MINVGRVRKGFFFVAIGFALMIGTPAIVGAPVDDVAVIQGNIKQSGTEQISTEQTSSEQANQKTQAKLEKIVNELHRRWDIEQVPTAGLSIVVDDQVISLRLGKAEKGLFELASTTKAFTGLLIALLEQEGVLNLYDEITNWLPELAEYPQMGYPSVQIQDLLFHNSGIAESTIDLLRPNMKPDALSQLPALLKNVPLAYSVGTREEYATLNYSLLGLIAERATGKPFPVLLREKVFLPLGMMSTKVEESIPAKNTEELPIPGYKISFTTAQPYDAPRYLQNTPAGYILSTPQDMAIWLQFLLHRLPSNEVLLNESILNESILKKDNNHSFSALYAAREQAKHPYAGDGNEGYAYGWDVVTDQTTYWSHPGQNPNAAAYVAFDPQEGVGIALLGNSNSPQVIELGQAIFEYLRGASPQILPEHFSVDINDRISTAVAAIFWLGGALFLLATIYKRGKKNIGKFFFIAFIALNTLLISGLAIAPSLLLGWSWSNLLVWGPLSLPVAAVGLIFLANIINLFFFNLFFFYSVKPSGKY
ncbi:putative penicillin binding protein [Xenorhabdus vietnamensis]|uniref:Putative penicillin binding protein n=1 Tax=Xenorhabdus vietnamensis TaxID=351656 RepID=A0A1Y2S9E4_9GAMM|nr:serine hydrolase domain-containing protein [Xenorhabdus vietnamensis]OTA15278.1 putative penicillin binding protein [Xenorhabdus vietnamensis]